MRPCIAPEALVLSLQNGVENAELLRGVLPQQTVAAAVVYVATQMASPGYVKHNGRGELVIEPSSNSKTVAQAFVAAGVPTEVSANVSGALWAKLILEMRLQRCFSDYPAASRQNLGRPRRAGGHARRGG